MSEKPKQKPSRLKKWLLRLGLVLLIAFAGFVLFLLVLAKAIEGVGEWMSSAPSYNLRGEEARESIEAYPVNVPLPEDAQDFYLYYFALQDLSAYIRFSASPESIDTWLNSHDFCFTVLIPNARLDDATGETLEWWNPNEGQPRAASEPCGSYLETGGYQIAIDQSNPDLWIVYLIVLR